MKQIFKTASILVFSLALVFSLSACGSSSSSSDSSSQDTTQEETTQDTSSTQEEETSYISTVSDDDEYASGTHHVKVNVKGYKSFTITLDADSAPITVSNFCKLVKSGFYDGLTFHRAVADFCLQGGDPQANGTGGSDDCILGEFSSNDVENDLADNYERGVVAMARATDPNSASSQFFITLSDDAAYSLNGQYAAFGTIDKAGMKIVDKITKNALKNVSDESSGTIEEKSKQPKIKSMTIID